MTAICCPGERPERLFALKKILWALSAQSHAAARRPVSPGHDTGRRDHALGGSAPQSAATSPSMSSMRVLRDARHTTLVPGSYLRARSTPTDRALAALRQDIASILWVRGRTAAPRGMLTRRANRNVQCDLLCKEILPQRLATAPPRLAGCEQCSQLATGASIATTVIANAKLHKRRTQ
jgi:hypothetical protein